MRRAAAGAASDVGDDFGGGDIEDDNFGGGIVESENEDDA